MTLRDKLKFWILLSSYVEMIVRGTSPLSLPDAIADSLEYLKAFGGTEQRNLPSGYTELEYIESTGTQYIDTGVNDVTSSEFEVIAQQTSITGVYPTIIGALDEDFNYKVICGLSTSNNTFYSQCGGPQGFIVSSVPNDTQKHTFKVTTTTNQQTLQVDDTAVVVGNYAITSTTGYSLTICARNKDTVSNFTRQKVFSVRIKKNGVLVRDFVPAKRINDNVVGMYDTVSQTFFTNAGTGTFIAGAPVDPVLPDNYIRRDYIYMLDGSYLTTNIVPTSDMRIELDIQTTSIPSTGHAFLGARNGSAGSSLCVGTDGNINLFFDGFSGTRYTSSAVAGINTRYKYTWNNGVATIESGGSVVATNTFTPSDTISVPLIINGLNSSGSVVLNSAGVYCYSFKVWNTQGELVANYVPAVQKGTVPVVGFYDTVSETFKGPTAGTFAAGPEHQYTTPTPDNPIDIWCNNGVLKLSKNLFDITALTGSTTVSYSGDTITIDGGTNVFVDKALKQLCPEIEAGKTYYLSVSDSSTTTNKYIWLQNGAAGGQWFFNTARTLSQEDLDTGIKMYCGTVGQTIVQMQIEQGSVATPYHPYGQIYADGTVETINMHTKNLYNPANRKDHYYLNDTGTEVAVPGTDVFVSDKITVSPSTTYTLSLTKPASGIFIRIAEYKADGTFAYLPVRDTASTGGNKVYTFTTTAATDYVKFQADMTATNVQLEQGSTATDYVPYFDGGTATAEMLLKVGDYEDVQSIIDGVLTRNVGIKVLDGTEGWTISGAGTISDPIRFAVSEFIMFPNSNTIKCLSTHYPFSGVAPTGASITPGTFNVGIYNNIHYIRFAPTDITTLVGWTNWLKAQYAAGTPVTVIYPLAQPVTEQVAPQVLNVQTGDNILEITQASLSNLELEAKYKKQA